MINQTIHKVKQLSCTQNLVYYHDNWHEIDSFEHVKFLQKYGSRGIKEFIEDEMIEINVIEESCEALAEQGEHPEWHCYEIAQSNFEGELFTRFLKEGGIRVNVQYRGFDGSINVHVDGLPQHLYKIMNEIDIAKQNPNVAKFIMIDRKNIG